MISKIKENIGLIFILMIPFIVLLYWNIKTSNIGFIYFYNLDYWHHYKVVMRMFEGLINLNPEVFYNIHPFFHYGTPVFLVYLFFSLPFMILEYDSMVIFTYKMVILSFALMSVTYLYFFSRLYLNKINSLLICTIFMGMPAFWDIMDYPNPFWMQSFLLAAALFYLAKDNANYSKNFWLSCILIGLAISTKIQAITFLPIPLAYIFHKELTSLDFSNLLKNLILVGKFFFIVLTLYIIFNPYILHPVGLSHVYYSIFSNINGMETLSTYEIIFNMFRIAYVHYIFFFIMILFLFYHIYRIIKFTLQPINTAVSSYIIVLLIYMLFMFQSANFLYYFPLFTVIIMMLALVLKDFKPRTTFLFLIFFAIFNFVSHTLLTQSYHYFDLNLSNQKTAKGIGIILNNNRLDARLELFEYWPFSKKSIIMENERANNKFLLTILKDKVTNHSTIALEAYVGFEFNKLNLKFTNVNQRHGAPLIEEHLKINDFIVLKKKEPKTNNQINLINKFNDYNNKISFYKIGENSNLIVYQKKIDS